MITTLISKSLFDPGTMVFVSADDTDDDLWTVRMPEEVFNRMAAATHGSTA